MGRRITVKGLVQGIGYRPFVAETAEQLHIGGWVKNVGGIVEIGAFGPEEKLDDFCLALKDKAPAGARVDRVICNPLEGQADSFSIITSTGKEADGYPLIPADLPTCPNCERELLDPRNHRYLHPFISCTACGPRYSIIESLPYDRDRITMKEFSMCPSCAKEYAEQGNRRRHAQTIACPDCGPRLRLVTADGDSTIPRLDQRAMDRIGEILKEHGILAIKDIGGFHLACSPFDGEAVRRLREIKCREAKPFAVMFASADQVKEYCKVSEGEEKLLLSDARPIVLLKHKGKELDPGVCGTSPDIGAMLPCNPIQLLLTARFGPLIMTSSNRSGELIQRDCRQVISLVEDYWREWPIMILDHDREILTSLDDSILRLLHTKKGDRLQTFRRARGLVPEPITAPVSRGILALGGDLKACFGYCDEGRIYPSQYLGDLEDQDCFEQYKKQLNRMQELFGFETKIIARDLHPAYRSRALAREDKDLCKKPLVEVQHHKAHAASVIAEHDIKEDAICFAFDGTGYGEDGGIWGGEVFAWKAKTGEMNRIDHIPQVRLIGGNEGAKNAETILYGYLAALDFQSDNPRFQLVKKALQANINTVTSSSMGRLFDAAGAALGICMYNSYEGQVPVELENLAATVDETVELGAEPLEWIEKLVHKNSTKYEVRSTDRAVLARSFIYAVADWIVRACDRQELKTVVLSGGSFQNRILSERVIDLLEEKGYRVYLNEKLPCGDGGIFLGQAFLAEKGKEICV